MVYNVQVTETYTYMRQIECTSESELTRILHEDEPLLIDRSAEEIEQMRRDGLHLKCGYEW